MAQLPTYRELGIRTINIDPVSTANLKAGAATWETLNDRISQMQKLVFEKGSEIRKEEAVADALKTPISLDTVKQSQAENLHDKSFMSSMMGESIYQKTFNETQGTMLANDVSLRAVENFNIMKSQAEAGLIDYATARARITDMVDGYTSAVGAYSSSAAATARGKMLTAGQTVLNSIGSFEVKNYLAQQEAITDEGLKNTQRLLEDVFERGNYLDDNGEMVSAEDVARGHVQTIVDRYSVNGNYNGVKKAMNVWREARVNGMTKAVMSSTFAENPSQAYYRLTMNDAGDHQKLWDNMTNEEREKVIGKIFTETANRKKLEDDAVKVDKEKWQSKGYDLWESVMTATTQEEFDAIHAGMVQVNEKLRTKFFTLEILKKVKTGAINEDANNPLMFDIEATFYNESPDDDYSVAQIRNLVTAKQLSLKQGLQLIRKKEAVKTRKVSEAVLLGKSLIGKEPALSGNSTTKNQSISKVTTDVLEALKNPENTLSPAEIVRKSVDDIYQQQWVDTFNDSAAQVAAALKKSGIYKSQLNEMEDPDEQTAFLLKKAQEYLNGNIPMSTFDALKIDPSYKNRMIKIKTSTDELRPK